MKRLLPPGPPLRFAATKIQPPRQRPGCVDRVRLDRAVQQALPVHRVVLLQAPAGFGKTTALAAQLARLPAGWAAAWVSLDEDDDAERLFACLVGALEPHDLPWRTAPEALVALAGADAAGLQRAAAELVNALAGSEPLHGLLVLDDLHRLVAPDACKLLDALVERLPPRWTLVLGSRTPPRLALARLRAGGELAEFGHADLRFSRDEAAAMLAAEGGSGGAVAGVVATADNAQALFDRTAGWPAGMRLALAALRQRGGAGAIGTAHDARLIDRQLFDYLAAEVLDNMPPALHDFLVRCAVLPELTAPRAAAVSGDARAAGWLDDIERLGLFATALEAPERTLVLHDLFRDALLARLRERLPAELPALLQRAAAGEADGLRRVHFLLRAGDWSAGEAALTDGAAELFLQGAAGEVLRLAEQFPAAHRSARLSRVAGAACCLRWQWADMASWYAAAAQTARSAGDGAELQLAQAGLATALYPLDRNAEAERLIEQLNARPAATPAARAATLLADTAQHFRRGQHAALAALYAELLDILEQRGTLFQWWECAPPINWSTIDGLPALIERYLAGAAERLGDRPLPMRAELRVLRGFLLLWQGRVDAAAEQLRAAEDDARWLGVSGELQFGVDLLGLILDAVQGREAAVAQRLDALLQREDGAPAERRLLWRHQMAVYGVRLSDTLALGPAALRKWAALLKENPLASNAASNPRALAVRARHAAAEGRWNDACALFAALSPSLPTVDVMGQRTDLTLRAAHALLHAGRLAEAAAVLAPVLARLRADGVHGQALLCGPALLRTLAAAPWGAALAADQRSELAAIVQLSAALRGAAAAPPAAPPAAGDGLSDREREVLQRIAAGDSNKLIARALDISPHTVKRHVANILDKLTVASRGQAAAWWQRQHP